MSTLRETAEIFSCSGLVNSVREFGNGNINKTYLVSVSHAKEAHFILQKINRQVFRNPERIMGNMSTVIRHVSGRLTQIHFNEGRRWEVPLIVPTREGKEYWIDTDGSFWRAITYIHNTRSYDTVKDSNHAEEAGYALGMFHNLISDLSCDLLVDTLEGFHVLPRYLEQYRAALRNAPDVKSREADYCREFVSSRVGCAGILESAKKDGKLSLRPIHGDPKVNNIMIDNQSGQAVGIIDLDTVKPGLVQYDIGDCLRSGCNPLGEEVAEWETVRFDADICRAILQGYIPVARAFLTMQDYDYLYDAVRLITFELGLRFFSDFLEGNVYFRVKHPEHNLARALVQFRLCESIESQKESIQSIVRDLRYS